MAVNDVDRATSVDLNDIGRNDVGAKDRDRNVMNLMNCTNRRYFK